MSKKVTSRVRMSKAQKFYIDQNQDMDIAQLSKDVGAPEDAIVRYQKKQARETKKEEEKVEPKTSTSEIKKQTVDELMIHNRERGVVIMTPAASQVGDSSKKSGMKSDLYKNVTQKIR
jgi:hypothetical protein